MHLPIENSTLGDPGHNQALERSFQKSLICYTGLLLGPDPGLQIGCLASLVITQGFPKMSCPAVGPGLRFYMAQTYKLPKYIKGIHNAKSIKCLVDGGQGQGLARGFQEISAPAPGLSKFQLRSFHGTSKPQIGSHSQFLTRKRSGSN